MPETNLFCRPDVLAQRQMSAHISRRNLLEKDGLEAVVAELEKAKASLLKHGWTQFVMKSVDGEICLLGACRDWTPATLQLLSGSWSIGTERTLAVIALSAYALHLGYEGVPQLNDFGLRSLTEAVAVIDETIIWFKEAQA